MTTLHQSCLWVLFLVLEPMLICHFDASNCDASPVAAAPNLNFIPLSPLSPCTCHSEPLAIGKDSKHIATGHWPLQSHMCSQSPSTQASHIALAFLSSRSRLQSSYQCPPASSLFDCQPIDRRARLSAQDEALSVPFAYVKKPCVDHWPLLSTCSVGMIRLSIALQGLPRV